MTDNWSWWRAALANPHEIGSSLPVHIDDPRQGFYRVRLNKAQPYEPVAIWEQDGVMVGRRGDNDVDPNTLWLRACMNPVSHEDYLAALDGKGWPDDDETVKAQIGDNSAGLDDAEALSDQIEAALAGMKAYETIEDDATAAKALSLRNRLNELSNQADKIRVEEKEPHLTAGKAVDAKWQPLVKKAKAGADTVRSAIGKYETAKLAEARRKQAEEAARAVEANASAQQPEEPNATVEPSAGQIRPTYGKAASVSVVKTIKQVTDWQALSAYLSTHRDVQALMMQIANRLVANGHDVPGVETMEEAKVR